MSLSQQGASTYTPNIYNFAPGRINVANASAPVSAPVEGTYAGPFANTSFLGQPFSFYLGMVLLLFLLKFLGEHERSPIAHEVAGIHIGGLNLLKITVAAAVGFASLKVLFTRWTVPGLSEFVNYI